jgi:uncharacterized membrane protein
MNFVYLYLISLPTFIALDLLWIGVIMKGFYQSRLGYLFGEVNWVAAILFYAIFLLGVTFFVTAPAVASGGVVKAILYGAFFGLVTYATYDLTNHATIKDWPLAVTVVDMLWGAFLGSVVAGVTVAVFQYFH